MRLRGGLLLLASRCFWLLFLQLQPIALASDDSDSKSELWRQLLAEHLPTSAPLHELATRLASLPDQQRAALLYLELSSASSPSNSPQAGCRVRTSLAQLSSPGGFSSGSPESPLEAARRRVQSDELPEGLVSSGLLNDAEVGSWLSLAQRLALDNANLLSRLGLHAPGLASEFVADEHFSKYLLELALLQQRLVPTRLRTGDAHPAPHPVHSVGLVFCRPAPADDEPRQEPEVEFAWLAEPATPRARLIDLRQQNFSTSHGPNHLAPPFYAKWALAPDQLQPLARDLATDRSLEQEDGRWFSPYRDCGLSNRWLLTYSVPLFGRLNGKPVFRGVSFTSLDFARLSMLNQCAPQFTHQPTSRPEEAPDEPARPPLAPEEADAARSLLFGSNQCWRLRGSKHWGSGRFHLEKAHHRYLLACVRFEPHRSSTLRLGHYLCLCAPGHQVMGHQLSQAVEARGQLELESSEWAHNASIPLNLLPIRQLSQPPEAALELQAGAQLAGSAPAVHHFQLGQQLEAEAALTWLLAWPEAKWPALSCRACLNTTTGTNNNQSTQPCHEPLGAGQLNDATAASWHPIRPLVAALQATESLFMLALLGLLMRIRKSRVIIASGRFMLTTTLVGALLLYSGVLLRCLKTSSLGCLLEAWLRELGFSIFYGSLLIKLYRIYTEFQTRKAHRVCLRDKDQMAYLMAIIFIVISYMSSWTVLVLDGFLYRLPTAKFQPPHRTQPFRGASLEQLFAGLTEQQHRWDPSHQIFSSSYGLRCRKLNWDYVTELNEMGLLLFGIYLIYKLRNASSKSHKEKLVLSVAFFLELLVSSATYAIRHVLWDRLTPEQLLLLYCARCQLTLTPTLALVFGPKLWTICRSRQSLLFGVLRTASGTNGNANNASLRHRCHITCELHDHHLNDAMRLHQAMLSSSTLDIGSINLVDMSPDEIKTELKRVYAQLELLKNKAMRRDNPHILRRRGGRKTGHRKFSLQAFHPRHIGKQASHPRAHVAGSNEVVGGPARTLEELEEEDEEDLERSSLPLHSGGILEEEDEEESKVAEEAQRPESAPVQRHRLNASDSDSAGPLPAAATCAPRPP